MTDLEAALTALFSGDDSQAEAAIAILAAQAPSALPQLLSALEDPHSDHRWWAARALAAIDDPRVPPILQRALADPDAAVRQCAALGLRLRPHPGAAADLVHMLNDRDRLTARLAGDALAALGAPATPLLVEALSSPQAAVRIEASRALASIQDKESIGALIAAVDDPSAVVQYWAEEALDRMGVGMVYFKPG